jgi:hypothetical protein
VDGPQSVVVENPFEGALQDGPSPVSLEVDRVFGAEEEPAEEVLGAVRDVEVDAAGNVYILADDRVLSFTPDGELRWELDARGEAPGELSRADRLAIHPDGQIWVNNRFGTRYEIYSLGGEFIRSMPVNALGNNRLPLVGFPDDSTAVVHRAESGVLGTHIMVMNTGDDPWTLRREFLIDQEAGDGSGDASADEIPDILTREPTVELIGRRIAVTGIRRYEISILTLTGDTVRVVRRDAPRFMRPGVASTDAGQRGIVILSALEGPVMLESGYALVSGYWPTNISDPDEAATLAFSGNAPPADFYRTLDVYDSDWRLLYSLDEDAFDEAGIERISVTRQDGFVYTREVDPFPRVVRYRVRIDDQGS